MVRMRLTGEGEEIAAAIEALEKTFKIIAVSDAYKNRDSLLFRVYVDVEIIKGQM